MSLSLPSFYRIFRGGGGWIFKFLFPNSNKHAHTETKRKNWKKNFPVKMSKPIKEKWGPQFYKVCVWEREIDDDP
jgi:hypothetical protein